MAKPTPSTWGCFSQRRCVYKVTRTGKLTVLYNFDGMHGNQPVGPLVQGRDGNFYGTTTEGGTNNAGVIFKVSARGKLTVLHNINGTTDGAVPFAGLAQATLTVQ